MEVRIANDDQALADAFFIRKTVFVSEQHVPIEEEIDQYEEAAVHFVLYNDDVPIGAGRFRILDGAGKIERICVLKKNRKSGAGKMVMERIEDYAKQQGIKVLKLNAQIQAIPFYSGLGYKVASEEFLDAGIPHKTMKKIV